MDHAHESRRSCVACVRLVLHDAPSIFGDDDDVNEPLAAHARSRAHKESFGNEMTVASSKSKPVRQEHALLCFVVYFLGVAAHATLLIPRAEVNNLVDVS